MKVSILTEQEIEQMIQRIASATAELMAEKLTREPDRVPGESTPLPYLDKRQAAKLLGCSTATVDNYRRSGKLKVHKLAGRRSVRFDRSELLALVGRK